MCSSDLENIIITPIDTKAQDGSGSETNSETQNEGGTQTNMTQAEGETQTEGTETETK